MDKITQYLKESFEEIKKVSWPTKEDTIRYTVLVVGISLFMAVFLGGLDFLATAGLSKALELKLK